MPWILSSLNYALLNNKDIILLGKVGLEPQSKLIVFIDGLTDAALRIGLSVIKS